MIFGERLSVLTFRNRYLTTLAAVAVFAALFAGFSADAGAATRRATLTVSVAGLPASTKADAKISGHGLHAKIHGRRTFRRLRPGRYTITVHQVRLTRTVKGVPKGSRVLAAAKRVRVSVAPGAHAKAVVRYGTIISARVRSAPKRVIKATGPAANPKTISVRASGHPLVGEIITSGPTAKLPGGLLHRVAGVKLRGTRAILSLKPVGLYDAFPQLDIDTTASFDGKRAATTRAHAALDPPQLSLNGEHFGCQVPLTSEYHVGFSQSFGAKADVALHVPKRFGIPVGLPDGKIILSLNAGAGFDLALPKDLGCKGSIDFPALPTAIPIGPVVVPAYFRVVLGASATVGDQGFAAKANGGLTLKGGFNFHGTDLDPVVGVEGNFGASASGGGKVTGGATLRFAIGVADFADVRADVKTELSYNRNVDRSCAADLSGGVDVGVALGPLELTQPLPKLTKPLYHCPTLTSTLVGPLGAFPNQQVPLTAKVTNTGDQVAKNVAATITLPATGSLASAVPSGAPAAPAPGSAYTIALGDLAPGASRTATVRWKAPATETTLSAVAHAIADNAPQTADQTESVPVGTTAKCNPCGAAFAGTGLRNRNHGAVTIGDVPPGATVGRAVLIWGILYDGVKPANTITFDGHPITADVSADVSGDLCWGDTNTVGYAADVTDYVLGNGTFHITEPPRGATRIDDEPRAVLPYTDGATLLVFYNGGGASNQVLSDFTYNTDTDSQTDQAINRTFTGIHATGMKATLTLAGPDGQSSPETFTVSSDVGSMDLEDTFDGSDPQDGPGFAIGNLWDTDSFDVTSLLPPGQTTLQISHDHINDCIGVGATVLQVAQP